MATIIKKVFMNKRTKQLSITIPKKQLKAIDSTLKFDKDLFVELKVLNSKKKK